MQPTDTPHPRPPSTAAQVAKKLGETAPGPCYRIRRIVNVIGEDQTWAFVREAEKVEANGGMMRVHEPRRRTFGGVFFRLVRTSVPQEQRVAIWPYQKKKKKKKKAARQNQPNGPSTPAAPGIAWAARRPLLDELRTELGSATTCKITVVGRPPERVVEKPSYTVMLMRSREAPGLPKGMPATPTKPAELTVYVPKKPWAAMKPQLANPDDAAMVNGALVYDPDLEGLAILGQDGTTLGLDATRRGKPLEPLPKPRPVGEASTLKALVVGRPGKVLPFGGAVLTLMQVVRIPKFPKGMPAAPSTPTLVLVVISAKQWNQVEERLTNPEDTLVVEGFPVWDGVLPGVALFATKTTTRMAQIERRPKPST